MNLLVTGAWGSAKEHIAELENMGHRVSFLQQEKEALPVPYEWVEGIIGNGIFLYHSIEKFSHLRYIQLTSAGFDRVPMDYVTKMNIEIKNAAGVYSIPMAEFAVAGVLSLYKQMRFFTHNQASHRWEKHRGLLELSGKTVCIIGCGSVGNECAKRFSAFGCRVLGIKRHPHVHDAYENIFSLDRLNDVLRESDVVVLTVPLTEETHHMMDTERLALLKDTAVLVNIARGAVVDTDALETVLNRIGGAVLDVFEEEPLPQNSPLWDAENVILTPHNSFVGEGNQRRLSNLIFNHLEVIS